MHPNPIDPVKWAQIEELWDRIPAAPEEPRPGTVHPVVHLAFDGCLDYAGFDISVLSKDEQDTIFVAALDAMPEGDEAAMRAAADRLVSMAVAGDWDEWLLGPDIGDHP